MEAIRSTETSIQFTRSTRLHIPEHGILHSTYRSSMKSGYSFAEFADTGLLLGKCNGNVTYAIRKYGEKCQSENTRSRTFLSADCRLRKTGKFCGMRWDVGRPSSVRSMQILKLVDRQPTVSTITGTSHTYVRRILQGSACVCTTRFTARLPPVNVFCKPRPKNLHLQQRLYSRMNLASLGLDSPIFTANICG
jgi:hypothetical protein